MKVSVNKDVCLGCGACVATCGEVFDFSEDQTYAEVKTPEVPENQKASVEAAKDSCPTGAINVEE